MAKRYNAAYRHKRAILHDENVYPDPLNFNPERFLSYDGNNTPNPDPCIAAFGYGRRYVSDQSFVTQDFH